MSFEKRKTIVKKLLPFVLAVLAPFLGLTPVLAAQPPTHSVTLTWAPSTTGATATGFNVYKLAATGSTCPTIGPLGTKLASVTTTTYVDTNASPSTSVLTEGVTYCYAVTATDAGGESSDSNIVAATIPFSIPGAPVLNTPVVK
jgi:hypothetical protein